MNKRILTTAVFILLVSTACLTTSVIPSALPAASTPPLLNGAPIQSTPEENQAGAVFDPEPMTLRPLCAIVTAAASLHMRAEPNEKAEVLAYLQSGEQVTVKEPGTWWKIEAQGLTGYAKGKYLQEVKCK